jgi:hypothetical protein
MAKVTIDGQEFTLGADKAQDLMQWLTSNGGVKVESTGADQFTGQQLLNEQPNPGANVGTIKPKNNPDGSGTYDFGTTWI